MGRRCFPARAFRKAVYSPSVINNPAAYWRPRCWAFTLDGHHLVPPLTTRLVPVKDWLLTGVRYDRQRRILELLMNTGEAFQHRDVPLELALKVVRAQSPATIVQSKLGRQYPIFRVRVRFSYVSGSWKDSRAANRQSLKTTRPASSPSPL